MIWLGPALTAVMFGLLLWLERARPLRRAVEAKLPRVVRNLGVAGVGAVVVQLVEIPLVLPLAALVERNGWGLVNWPPLPAWLTVALAVVLLDYTLYVWHVLTHRVPLLWRFHLVHHADLDLDASTALRFHAGELLLSVPWRAAQVMLIGVSPSAYLLWQGLVIPFVLFHHSNVALPAGLERALVRLVVTPRMHGIHHSVVREERDSNWSSGLTLWDRLHGTLKLDVPQERITIGVPGHGERGEVTFGKLFAMPFVRNP